MTQIKRHALEGLAWFIALPAILIATFDPDLGRLLLGAFGPPARTVLLRWIAVGAALTALAFWRHHVRRDGLRLAHATRRIVGLAALVVVAFAVVVFRGREFATRDVVFAGPDTHIAATIYSPRLAGPHPAVIFVPGSAPIRRGFYSLWAEHLASNGVVSIVPDKRGVGGTGGEFERNNNGSLTNLELLAGDVVAALDFAVRLPEVDTVRLGLFGLSQAGWVAPMAALRSPRARFVVMITGPAVSGREEAVWSDLRGDDRERPAYSRQDAERIMDSVTVGGVDARPRLRALTVPGLWLFGTDDNSIPTRKSVLILDSLKSMGKRFHVDTFPGAGHVLFTRVGGLLPHVANRSWDSIDAWFAREIRGR